MPSFQLSLVVLTALLFLDFEVAFAGVEENRLNETSFQIRFEGSTANDPEKIDRQFLHHVASAVRKHGYDEFVFRVPGDGSAVVLVQNALSYQPATFSKGPHIRDAIVISYKRTGAPADAFDAKFILEKPLPADDVASSEPAPAMLPPASEVLPPEASMDVPVPSHAKSEISSSANNSPSSRPPSAPPAPQISPKQSLEKFQGVRSGFSFGVYSPFSSTVVFDDVKLYVGSAHGKGRAEFELETGPVFAFEYFHQVDQGWGYRVGALIEKQREFRSAELTINGSTVASTESGRATLQLMTFLASAEYSSGSLFFPIGLNVTNPTFDPGSNPGVKYDYSGGFGAQFGAGLRVNEHITIDLLYLVQSTRIKGTQGTTILDYGLGYQRALNLGLKLQIPTSGF